MLKSDNSSLAKDCRKEIKGITSKIAKLGRKVRNFHCSISFLLEIGNCNSARRSRVSTPKIAKLGRKVGYTCNCALLCGSVALYAVNVQRDASGPGQGRTKPQEMTKFLNAFP